jgi:hypothetical protein
MKKKHLSFAEQYDLECAKGYRLGTIMSSRKIALNCHRICGKEQGTLASKALVSKVKRETDQRLLEKFIMATAGERLTIAELEIVYDMIFLTKEELQKN